MFEKSQGYLKASKAEGFTAARAQNELRADPAFHQAVSDARVSIAERLAEDYIALADTLKTRPDDYAAIQVRLKARQFIISHMVPTFKAGTAHTSVSIGDSNVMMVCDEAQRARLIEQRVRLMNSTTPKEQSAKVVEARSVEARTLDAQADPEAQGEGGGPPRVLAGAAVPTLTKLPPEKANPTPKI